MREDLEYEIRAYLLTLLRQRAFPSASERSGDRFLAKVLSERLEGAGIPVPESPDEPAPVEGVAAEPRDLGAKLEG